MYFYFYDKCVQERKYESVLAQIEGRLVDLGIKGRKERFSMFKNAQEIVEDGIKQGAQTVVAVGDDKTMVQLIHIIGSHPDITLGFIPIHNKTRFGSLLGIPTPQDAPLILSKRLCETIDLGRVGDTYFFGEVVVDPDHVEHIKLRCDKTYSVQSVNAYNTMSIANWGNIFLSRDDATQAKKARALSIRDGKLNVLVTPISDSRLFKKFARNSSEQTNFPVNHAAASSTGEQSVSLVADDFFTIKTPCRISICPNALKLIVGRDRLI